MATSMLTPIDMNKLEVKQLRLQFASSGAAPASPVEGQIAWFSDTHIPVAWNGSAWVSMFGAAATFAAPSFTLGTSNAAGAATTGVRSDASVAVFDATVPTTSALADAAAVGSAAFAARRDHVHGRESFGAVSALGTTAGVNGTATTPSHSDHQHAHTHGDHSLIVLNDLAAATAGYSMGGFKLTSVGLATASTDAASLANKISDFAAPSVDVSWSSHKITNLLDPTTAQDAATKNYVDSVAQGLTAKGAVRAATTAALAANTYANGTAGVGATLTANSNGIMAAVDGQTLGGATSQTITAMTNASTTVTATVASNANLAVGQEIVVAGSTGFTTNNPNGTWVVASLVGTTQFTFVVALAPTGSYTASSATEVTAADAVLVKNEATGANNGVYIVTQVGTASLPYILTRRTDMDAGTEFSGSFVFAEQGTANGKTGWVNTNAPGAVVTGTTAIAFAQFSGAGTFTADETTLHLAGTVFSIISTYVGQASIITVGTIGTGTWQGTAVALGFGGTGQTTAALARGTSGIGTPASPPAGGGSAGVVTITARGVPTKVSCVIGDGATTTITVNHNLGTRDVDVMVYRATTPWDAVIPDVQMLDTNNVNLIFAVAPTASQFNAVVVG